MSNLFKLFGAIQKIDDNEDGTITVHGVASSESRDGAGEIIRASAMQDALPDYSKFPALREMHQPLAAGKVLEAEVDEEGVTHIAALVVDPVAIVKVRTGVYGGFSIGGKVLKRDPSDRSIITGLRLIEISLVDSPCNPDAKLTMWKADIMSEFKPSRDAVVARAKELAKAAGHGKRFTEHLFDAGQELIAEHVLDEMEKGEIGEISIGEPLAEDPPAAEPPAEAAPEPAAEAPAGDAPAIEPEAQAAPAAALGDPAAPKEAAAQGDPDPAEEDHSGEGAAEPDAPEAKEAAAEGEPIAEADPIADPAAQIEAALSKGENILEAGAEADAGAADPFADLEKVAAAMKGIEIPADPAPLAKGMYEVSRFADLLSSFSYVQRSLASEADWEGDNSPIPGELAAKIKDLGDLLIRLAQEEIAELVASLVQPEGEPAIEIVYCGEEVCLAEQIVDLVKADEDLMAKAGARHSAADKEHIQKAHDHLAKLGAACDQGNCAKVEGADDVAAAAASVAEDLETENASLKKLLAEAAPRVEKLVEGFEAELAELRKRFEAEPMPLKTAGPAALRAVNKGQDSAGAGAADAQPNPLEGKTADEIKKYFDQLPEAERGHLQMRLALRQPHLIAQR